MLFYGVLCVYFLAILAIKPDRKLINAEIQNPEAIFADVIKNISRVNNVLQDLITNYEHLQQVYKSQEHLNPQRGFELDRNYKITKQPQYLRESPEFGSVPLDPTDDTQETQMVGSEGANSKNRESTDQSKEGQPEPVEIQTQSDEITNKMMTTTVADSAESFSSEEHKDTTRAIRATRKRTTDTITTKTTPSENQLQPKEPIESAQDKGSQIVFLDTHKTLRHKEHKNNLHIMPEIAYEETTKRHKTKYTVQETFYKADNYGNLKEMFLRQNLSMESPPSKKLLRKSPFLQTDKETNKTEKGFIAKDKPDDATSSLITDDDEALNKDMFKTNILRQAYGDACLKLVVRKCYKACKKTLRSSCRITKCSRELKSLFKTTYKTRCEEVFQDTPGTYRRYSNSAGVHVDLARDGYLAVACQPRSASPSLTIAARTGTSQQNGSINKDTNVNILRDRYEKACQKISRNKCQQACNYAQNATCTQFQCVKSLRSRLKRNCKVHCKIAYTPRVPSKGKGGSTDDSYADSEEYTESDEDYTDYGSSV